MCEVVLNFKYAALNWTAPNWITLNWTRQTQTKVCITKSSCVNKRENGVWLKLTDTISILGLCPLAAFKNAQCFGSQLCVRFRKGRT